MSEVKCLICGKTDERHHDFSPPPRGCVCSPSSWEGSDYVPEPCRSFSPHTGDAARCSNCEHDKGCHE